MKNDKVIITILILLFIISLCLFHQQSRINKLELQLDQNTRFISDQSHADGLTAEELKMIDSLPRAEGFDPENVILPNGENALEFACTHDKEWLRTTYPEMYAKCSKN